MGLKKYLPTITQTVQVLLVMIVLTTLGLVTKGRSFFGKLIGR